MSKRKPIRKNSDDAWSAVFHPEFLEDLRYWVKTDRKVVLRILDIVEDTLKDPFIGIGKPEHLKYLPPETWSRRLTQEHRIVYTIKESQLHFIQARLNP